MPNLLKIDSQCRCTVRSLIPRLCAISLLVEPVEIKRAFDGGLRHPAKPVDLPSGASLPYGENS
jgi:hypothetical protein